jgi:hypothetical protein
MKDACLTDNPAVSGVPSSLAELPESMFVLAVGEAFSYSSATSILLS